jgi:hypothetical protein
MPARPWPQALGLRGRIVGAVLVTTVATLAVAALALLGPLEHELRNSALKTLARDLGRGASSNFARLSLTYVLDTAQGDRFAREGHQERQALARQQRTLGDRLGATVTLLGYPSAGGDGQPILRSPEDSPGSATYGDAALAFRARHRVDSLGTLEDGTEVARVALPLTIGGQRYVLAVRRPITEVANAVHVVRNAFLTAALAGLALTLALAIPLAATLVRRLRRRSSSRKKARACSCPSTAPATRSAISRERFPSCSASCDTRRRRGARSWRPLRTSCVRR